MSKTQPVSGVIPSGHGHELDCAPRLLGDAKEELQLAGLGGNSVNGAERDVVPKRRLGSGRELEHLETGVRIFHRPSWPDPGRNLVAFEILTNMPLDLHREVAHFSRPDDDT